MTFPGFSKRSRSRSTQTRRAMYRAVSIESLEIRQLLSASWTKLANSPPSGIEAMTLLSNGDVLGQIYGNAGFALLTPSSTGSYINGTWPRLPNMPDTRTYYSTQMLTTGNVYIAGGEYGSGGATGGVLNTVTNSWTAIPSGVGSYIDADSEILNNGLVLEAPVYPATSGYTYLYNASSNTWTTGAKLYRGSDADEQNWVKLADGSILAPDGKNSSERYIQSTGKWVNDATDAIAQTDSLGEFGTGVLLPNGKAFYVGTGSTTEIYTPSGYNSSTGIYSPSGTTAGSWSAGPTLPSTLGQDDAPMAVLPDGNVLFTAGPVDSYSSPTSFYIYNYASNTISLSTGAPTVNSPPYVNRFLDLPDGTVLMSTDSGSLYVYNDAGTTLTAPAPTISSIVHNTDGSYTLTGTQLTGNSEGAYFGDDAQMNSNYPIVRLTSSAGTVYFARTYNWSTTNIDTGVAPVTTNFTLPPGLPAGTYTLNVMVNGFISAGSTLTTPAVTGDAAPTVATAAAAAPSPATGTTVALSVLGADSDGGGESNLTYTWVNTAAPSGDSTAAFSVNGTNAAKNTTATFQQAGTYAFKVYITDSSGLSVTSTVSVTVNQTLTSMAITPGAVSLTAGQTQQLTATAYDQFGNAMSTQPTFTWSITGNGTISTAGLYTSPATGTRDVVTAVTGSFSATDVMYVVSSPWISTDIGSPGVAGTAFDTGGTFNVSGSGLDVWGTADHFHYVYRSLGGDGEITARVVSEPNPVTGWEKAGVMIRATLDESSQQADMSITPGNGAAFQYRTTAGGSSTNDNSGTFVAPYWVKLVRSGNTFTSYYSANGINWTSEGSATIVMTGPVYVGLFITSQSDTQASTVTFDNVSLLDAAPDALTVSAGATASVNVLANDVGPSGSTLTLTGVTGATKGTVTFNAAGGVTYNASAAATGSDTFTYTMSDGLGDTATGTVTVNILGLQAYWKMNEGTGTTTADATGDGFTGTLTGATWSTGVDGSNGIAFNGSGQYVSAPALNLNTNTVTISAWINISGTQNADAGIVFEREGNSGNGLDFYNTTTLGYTWGTSASTYNFNTGLKPTAGVWTFVALVISASGANFYMQPLGGVMSTASQNLSEPVQAFSGITGIGEDPNYTTRDYKGSMDEVRVYNVALNATQIAAIASLKPTVATPAAAAPSPVTGTTAALSVLGADYNGESALTYTWAATSLPGGATAPVFSSNGTNAAKNTTATFSAAGNYTFTVTIADSSGLSTTSTVSVTVNQAFSSIAISPASAALTSHASQQFTAVADDQFGHTMTTQPGFTWNTTAGSITATGLFTAGYSSGSATVTAASGAVTQAAAVTVTNAAPTVAQAAAASPSTVTASTTAFSVLGADDAGESNLSYTWAAIGTPPAPVVFSSNGTNAAKNSTATFSRAGSYTLGVTITDAGGAIVSSTVVVTVNQTITSLTVSPSSTNVHAGGTVAFSATAFDQFGNALTTQPAFTWGKTSGVGSINASSGVYTAPAGTGSATITAGSDGVTGSASVTVNNAAPTIATPAAASPSTVTGVTTALSVLAADDGGESNLTYTWTASTVPAGATAPGFTANSTNAAKNTTATFLAAGAYTFTVTVTDAQGLTTSSSVNVTVNQTLSSISINPANANVLENQSQAFSAVGYDQFGSAMVSPPAFTWSLGSGGGSINAGSGVYTAPSTAGTAQIIASSGGVTGTTTVTITYSGPTVVTPATASPSSVTGGSVALSVLGADPAGESNLTYTWAASNLSNGAIAPGFSNNGTNAAKNTTATFTHAGSYTFTATITDAGNQTITSSVTVTVTQTLSSVGLSSTEVVTGQTTQATALDQFGNAMTTQPAWNAGGGGTISSTGLFTAGSGSGSFTISATAGSVTVGTGVTVVGTTFTGVTGGDTYAIRLSPTDSSVEQVFVNAPETGAPTYAVLIAQIPSLTFNTASDGSVTVDFANGNPLPAGGISYSGGAALFVEGNSSGRQSFTVNTNQVIDTDAAASPITLSGIGSIEFDLTGGGNTLTQSAQPGAVLTFNAGPGDNTLNVNGGSFGFNGDPQTVSGNLTVNDRSAVTFAAAAAGSGYNAVNLAALNIGAAATAVMTASTTTADRTVLETGSLSISGGGSLDLGNGALVAHRGDAAVITGLIADGAITSSTASADPTALTTVGAIANNYSGSTIYSSFDNQSVGINDVLVRYTYYGDANLDGQVDGSDYTKIDNGYNNQLTGWLNGDFNGDGSIDGSDYTLIDNAFNIQGAELPAQPPSAGTISAPVAEYEFDSISTGTAIDSSGNNHTAVVHGATTATGIASGNGVALSGSNQYLSVPSLNLNSSSVTLSGWIDRNGSQTNGAGLIFNRTSGSGDGLIIEAGDRLGYSWGRSGATTNFNSNLIVPDHQWTFVALVVTSGNATLYMRPAGGTLREAVSPVANAVQSFTSPTWLGEDSQGNKAIKGSLDDVRLYGSALNAGQIGLISNLNPVMVSAAASIPSADVPIQTYLTAQAAAGAGDSAITYNWAVSSAPAGATVNFSTNGTVSSNNTTATGSVPGTYTFTVTATTADHRSISSSVSETFDANPFDIAQVNYAPAAPGKGIQPLSLGNFYLDSRTPTDFQFNDNPADRWVLELDSLTLVAPYSQIDLGNNDMIVHSDSAADAQQTLAAVSEGISAGYGLGGASNWTYPGIVSSLAAADPTMGLGVMLNMNSQGKPIYTTFDGVSVKATDVLVKYTKVGDANLDGVVNTADAALLKAGAAAHSSGWYNGDFNYDGVVDAKDAAIFAAAATQAATPAAQVFSSAVTVAAPAMAIVTAAKPTAAAGNPFGSVMIAVD